MHFRGILTADMVGSPVKPVDPRHLVIVEPEIGNVQGSLLAALLLTLDHVAVSDLLARPAKRDCLDHFVANRSPVAERAIVTMAVKEVFFVEMREVHRSSLNLNCQAAH